MVEDYLRWDGLVMKLAVKYGANPRVVRDSWQYSSGWIGLMKAAAVRTAYIPKGIKNEILTELTYQRRLCRNGRTRVPFEAVTPAHDCSTRLDAEAFLAAITDVRCRRIIKRRFYDDLTYGEIAALEQSSEDYVRVIIRTTLAALREHGPKRGSAAFIKEVRPRGDGFRLIQELFTKLDGLSASEVSRQTGVNLSTCRHVLHSNEHHMYVRRNGLWYRNNGVCPHNSDSTERRAA